MEEDVLKRVKFSVDEVFTYLVKFVENDEKFGMYVTGQNTKEGLKNFKKLSIGKDGEILGIEGLTSGINDYYLDWK